MENLELKLIYVFVVRRQVYVVRIAAFRACNSVSSIWWMQWSCSGSFVILDYYLFAGRVLYCSEVNCGFSFQLWMGKMKCWWRTSGHWWNGNLCNWMECIVANDNSYEMRNDHVVVHRNGLLKTVVLEKGTTEKSITHTQYPTFQLLQCTRNRCSFSISGWIAPPTLPTRQRQHDRDGVTDCFPHSMCVFESVSDRERERERAEYGIKRHTKLGKKSVEILFDERPQSTPFEFCCVLVTGVSLYFCMDSASVLFPPRLRTTTSMNERMEMM